MRIALVGGVFEYSRERQASLARTPEIVLLDGLSGRGHQVIPVGIRDWRGALRAAGQADVVHVHHVGRATLALSLRAGGAPLVYTPHAWADPVRRDLRFTHGRMLTRADSVVALSPREAARYTAAVRDASRVVVIPNGLDASAFPFMRRTSPPIGGRWRLLYVGQLIPVKQVELLIRAVADDRLRGRCQLRLVYHNDRDRRGAELRRLAHALGVSDQVVFAGEKSRTELAGEYHAAHMLLLASRSEALPSVITEAMFTGLPVIAPDVGGIAWQLGDFGHCLPRVTADTLPAAVVDVMRRYECELRAGEQASEAARRRFNDPTMVEAHERLYRKLIDRRRGRPGGKGVAATGLLDQDVMSQ